MCGTYINILHACIAIAIRAMHSKLDEQSASILCLQNVPDFLFWVKWNKLGVKLINVGKYTEAESETRYTRTAIIRGFIITGYSVYCHPLIAVISSHAWRTISVPYWLHTMSINKKKKTRLPITSVTTVWNMYLLKCDRGIHETN